MFCPTFIRLRQVSHNIYDKLRPSAKSLNTAELNALSLLENNPNEEQVALHAIK